MSFKPEVQAPGPDWNGNVLRFATREEAEDNARDLESRWTLVTAWRVIESDDPVNYRWVDGRLAPATVAQEMAQRAFVHGDKS